jgi:hypothetical protein
MLIEDRQDEDPHQQEGPSRRRVGHMEIPCLLTQFPEERYFQRLIEAAIAITQAIHRKRVRPFTFRRHCLLCP